MAATDLFLIRHGETEWNRLGRWCGTSDPPLSDRGRREAEALAAWIRHLPIAAVYASPLARAVETARLVSEAVARPVRLRRSLLERGFGAWEGLTNAEIEAGWPDLFAAIKADPSETAAPGGESCARVATRIRRALGALARVHPSGTIAVVGHQTAWRIFLAPFLGIPLRDYYRRMSLANSSVSLVRFRDADARVIWHNRTGHLGAC